MTNKNFDTLVLVTGGSGFLGVQCILQLLQAGYRVRATLRSLDTKGQVLEMLQRAGISGFERLEFVLADLAGDENWNQAAKGCTYVLHVASPVRPGITGNDQEMIRPAVDGTIRVLLAAYKAGAKRVVMTSDFAAIGYSHIDNEMIITEEFWTNPNEKKLSAYSRSKVLAERAAWDFIRRSNGGLELSVINPVGMFGPSLGPCRSGGAYLLKKLLDGSIKMVPNITVGIVDVRDVAELHIRAMTHPNAKGHRFLALAVGVMTLPEIAALLRRELGDKAKKVPTRRMPDWVIRVAAPFSPKARRVLPQLGRYREASNSKAINLLSWKPRNKEEALLAAAHSLLHFKVKSTD